MYSFLKNVNERKNGQTPTNLVFSKCQLHFKWEIYCERVIEMSRLEMALEVYIRFLWCRIFLVMEATDLFTVALL
jgi:hypothetical protein